MSFLNAALAFGTAAFTIPLIIHLFFRSRFKTVQWGAMHLLERVVRVNRRRMKLTNWLLLLLRCAIPILLALCLARPVLTGFANLAGDGPKTLVIALDDSRSMSATPPGGTSRIETAKTYLREILDDLGRRDEVILVRSSRLSAIPAKAGVADAVRALRKVTAQGGAVSIGNFVEAAHDAAQLASHPRRHVLVVSDFQSNSLESSSVDAARRVAETEIADERGNRCVFDFLNVGGQSDQLANLSVDAVSIDSPVVVGKRAGVYSATIRNSSELPAHDLRLVWSIDGKPLEPRLITVEAKSTATNRLTTVIDEPGMHEVAVSITRNDVLSEDNRRAVAVDVMREINVLLIDGAPRRESLKGQADFLSIALSPFAFGGDDRPDPVQATVVSERQLATAFDENEVRVVILAGVGRLKENARSLLVDFVHAGGSLVTFDGEQVTPDFYNQPWRSPNAELSFPGELGSIESADAASDQLDSAFRIDAPAQLYQPWQILSSRDQNPLSEVRVTRFRKLALRPGETQANDTKPIATQAANIRREESSPVVLLRTTEGDPIAVSNKVGDGTVVQFAITGNLQWSNLPIRRVFLPLIQQMVLDLAGKKSDSMIDVGDPIVLEPSDWPRLTADNANANATYFAETPLGKQEIQSPDDGQPIRLTSTYSPGLYRIEKRVRSPKKPHDVESVETIRIAEVPASESMLVDVTTSRLDSVAETLGASVFMDAAVFRSADRTRSFGREIWRPLLVLLLIALVAELWLQQNLLGTRRAAKQKRQTAGATA